MKEITVQLEKFSKKENFNEYFEKETKKHYSKTIEHFIKKQNI